MNKVILTTYEVTFHNKIYGSHRFPQEIRKTVSSANDYLTEFIESWSNAADINEYLMPGLNEGETGSEAVVVYVKNNQAYFYDLFKPDFSNSTADFIMPVNDLIEIINSWKEFLAQQPMNGSKI